MIPTEKVESQFKVEKSTMDSGMAAITVSEKDLNLTANNDLPQPSVPFPEKSQSTATTAYTPSTTSTAANSTLSLPSTLTASSSTPTRTKEPEPESEAEAEPAIAWLHCIMGTFVLTCTMGLTQSWGIFQVYYQSSPLLASGGVSHSAIAWIGSTQLFFLFFLAAPAGLLADAGFFRPLLGVGSLLLVLGLALLGLARTYAQVFVLQGLVLGAGAGCVFNPAVACVAAWFGPNRSLALGVLASGAAVGGMVFPAMFQGLLPRVGFAWTVRAMALLVFVLLGCVNVVLRPKVVPGMSLKKQGGRRGGVVDWTALREGSYVLFMLGVFLMSLGTFVGFFYVGSFGRDIIHTTPSQSFSLIIIINGIGFITRLACNYISGRYTTPMAMLLAAVGAGSVAMYAWPAVATYPALLAWDCVYGVCGAAMQGLFPAAMFGVCKDVGALGVRMGMVFSVMSFACLTASPVAGALIAREGGRYLGAQMFAGSALLLAFVVLVAARLKSPRVEKVVEEKKVECDEV